MNKHLKTNRRLWDALTPIHVASEFYDVEGFRRGKCTLDPIEVEEVWDVTGKSLLHLQCHFGLDTLSWARRGAIVTGADFSEKAIAQATQLGSELSIPAEFICCELSELPSRLSGQFDIIFTSAGVLVWLPDLRLWARVIAHFLKPGGVFYIREFHPFAHVMDDEQPPECPPRLRYPYFHRKEPMEFPADDSGDYADREAHVNLPQCEWFHSVYQSHPFLRQDNEGRWRYPEAPETLPLMFSLKATKA